VGSGNSEIIRKAGLTPWSRLFHNLRATRQTELAEDFPAHVICSWIGNTERVAQNHYLQVTDLHFQKAAQYPAESTGKDEKAESGKRDNKQDLQGVTDQYGSAPAKTIAATGLEPVTRGL
jgi:hypothetical protein